MRDVCSARQVLEGAGVCHWQAATPEARARVRTTLDAYTSAVRAGASYEELNERHLAFHVALVGLTVVGIPMISVMGLTAALAAELKA